MQKSEVVLTESKVIVEIICDKCKKSIPNSDIVEWQEHYTIDFVGGWGSVFGDGDRIQCDLCQECLYELIGSYYRVVDTTGTNELDNIS